MPIPIILKVLRDTTPAGPAADSQARLPCQTGWVLAGLVPHLFPALPRPRKHRKSSYAPSNLRHSVVAPQEADHLPHGSPAPSPSTSPHSGVVGTTATFPNEADKIQLVAIEAQWVTIGERLCENEAVMAKTIRHLDNIGTRLDILMEDLTAQFQELNSKIESMRQESEEYLKAVLQLLTDIKAKETLARHFASPRQSKIGRSEARGVRRRSGR